MDDEKQAIAALEQTDWPKLLADLSARNYTQPVIASICGCGQATISELANGKTLDPRDSLGQKLRALHKLSEKREAA